MIGKACISVVCGLVIAVSSSRSVFAQQGPTTTVKRPTTVEVTGACSGGSTGSPTCEGQVVKIYDTSPEATAIGSSAATGPTKRYVPYTRIDTGTDGQPCLTTGWREVTDPSLGDAIFQTPDTDSASIGPQYPPCPQSPNVPAEVARTPTPVVIAIDYWEEVPLPVPKPYIAPGWAIVGKLGYLETRGATQHVYRTDTVLGPLEIVATGRYYVDWGDGESSGPHSREGKPWPEGEITHDYIWAGQYDIVLTERWTATWSLAGNSGVLRELRTTGRIDDFPARQIQAVVGRP